MFDRNVQKEKRTHWIKEQENLIGLYKKPKEFWKKMNSLGNVKKNQKEIPMEIITNDGSVTNDEHAVLERWANDFAGLYNRPDLADNIDNIRSENNISVSDSTMLNTTISKSEVQESIMNAKRGKATGIDEIPVEVLNNTTAVAFLVSLFQACLPLELCQRSGPKGL